jgi:hypothetical protein
MTIYLPVGAWRNICYNWNSYLTFLEANGLRGNPQIVFLQFRQRLSWAAKLIPSGSALRTAMSTLFWILFTGAALYALSSVLLISNKFWD